MFRFPLHYTLFRQFDEIISLLHLLSALLTHINIRTTFFHPKFPFPFPPLIVFICTTCHSFYAHSLIRPSLFGSVFSIFSRLRSSASTSRLKSHQQQNEKQARILFLPAFIDHPLYLHCTEYYFNRELAFQRHQHFYVYNLSKEIISHPKLGIECCFLIGYYFSSISKI